MFLVSFLKIQFSGFSVLLVREIPLYPFTISDKTSILQVSNLIQVIEMNLEVISENSRQLELNHWFNIFSDYAIKIIGLEQNWIL